MRASGDRARRCPCALRDLFGLNFVFRPAFRPVLPAYAGFFVLLLLFQKIGLGKLLSVNYLLCLFELKFLRVVRVHCGGDRAAQRVARPDADDLACYAGLFTTADEGVAQLVRVVVRQQSLHARRNSVEVGVLRFLKVDIREYLFHLRCERNLPKHDILPQPFLARFALQPLAVDDLDTCKLGFSQTEIEKNKQSVRTFDVLVRLAVIDEPCLFVFGERFALLGLVGGQYDLFHGRGDIVILCRHIEDAMQHEREFLRLAVFVFAHDAEEIVLQIVPCDVCERFVAESRFQVHAEGTFILLKGGRLRRLFLDLQPLSAIIPKEDCFCRCSGRSRLLDLLNGWTFIESGKPVHKALAHGLEVSAGRLNVHSLAAYARLEVSVRGDAVVDDVVVCDKNLSDRFRHGFDLLFGEFETVFALFRKFPVFPVQGDGVHCLANGAHLPVKRRERIFDCRCGKCSVVCRLFSH